MKKILLACNAGMSTSLLVSNMEKAAKKDGIDVIIQAVPVTQAENIWKDWDIVMLGPQVRHLLKALNAKIDGNIPVEVINMRDYGTMNGANVLKAALEKIGG